MNSGAMKLWRSRALPSQTSRGLSVTCRGAPISREKLYEYTNGGFLVNEDSALRRRYLKFNVDELCSIASTVGSRSPVSAVEKVEGGFSKALMLKKQDGSEVVAKLPFKIAGPPKYTTAAEVAVLQYLNRHTEVPVPRVLAWSSDSTNTVGAEYIIMEKAPGTQLVKKWAEMEDYSHFMLIKNLCAIEAQLAAIRLPASGSLYLRESMTHGESYEPLDRTMDPEGLFCIGPSCEQAWTRGSTISTKGPWSTLPAFGKALVERETARIKGSLKEPAPTFFRIACGDDQIALLKMTEKVMARMSPDTLPGRLSSPTLWHTDLHLGNIYVSNEDPTQIVSLIDWQAVVVSPLFCQVRFPAFLELGDEYEIGGPVPRLPENIDAMEEDDREILKYEHKQACMGKAYEAASGFRNKDVYKALQLPPFFKEVFVRCGDVGDEGIVPLRACLIKIIEVWEEAGFKGDCPIAFSEEELAKHEREFQEYTEFHFIQGLARKYLGTDTEGWISPGEDMERKRQQNQELLQLVMDRSSDHGKTPDEVRQIWPY